MSTKPSTGRVRSVYEFIKAHRDQYSAQLCAASSAWPRAATWCGTEPTSTANPASSRFCSPRFCSLNGGQVRGKFEPIRVDKYPETRVRAPRPEGGSVRDSRRKGELNEEPEGLAKIASCGRHPHAAVWRSDREDGVVDQRARH